MTSRVRRHIRRGRPVRSHVRHARRASIEERGDDVVITIDKQDFNRAVKHASVFERKIVNAELHKMGLKGVRL